MHNLDGSRGFHGSSRRVAQTQRDGFSSQVSDQPRSLAKGYSLAATPASRRGAIGYSGSQTQFTRDNEFAFLCGNAVALQHLDGPQVRVPPSTAMSPL
jgi:hypothetical protein